MGITPSDVYPALVDGTSGDVYSLADRDTFEVGRSQQADLPLLDTACSRRQFRLSRQGKRWFVENLSQSNPTTCQGVEVNGSVELAQGARISAGRLSFRFFFTDPSLSERLDSTPVGSMDSTFIMGRTKSPALDQTVFGAVPETSGSPITIQEPFVVQGQMLVGRDQDRVLIHLPHPNVSRVHAQIRSRAGAVEISDLNSANGTFVNGRRIETTVTLRTADRIDIGPFSLLFDGKRLVPGSRANNVELVARNLKRVVPDRTTGRPLTILDGVSLVVRPKEFICLLGPSGSGKSTLLSALSARVPATEGAVSLNGEDLYANFDSLKYDIAVVPQRDVLHDLLPLDVALGFTARLRLPEDTSDEEIQTAISTMVDTVGLTERRSTRIRDMSGGQIKRASLANEIISQPSLLFLDEVTSGLDEQTDREMMRLFRKIADTGKTVVCITHSVANVERNCDLVVILTEGGKLAFLGSPSEALEYFDIEYLGDVYEKLEEMSPEEWKEAFAKHPFYKQYVEQRLPKLDAAREVVVRPAPRFQELFQLYRHQLGLLSSRYFRVLTADTYAMAMMAGQCLLVAILLCLLFGDMSLSNWTDAERKAAGQIHSAPPSIHDPEMFEYLQTAELRKKVQKEAANSKNMLFLMAITCLWFGCNNSSKEVVKERAIFAREHDVNLLIPAYYSSKFLLLGAIGIVQSLLLFLVVRVGTGFTGNGFYYAFVFALIGLTGTAMGLFLSVVAKTEDQATTLVPIALIPQIVLAGVITALGTWVEPLSQLFVTSYWATHALVPMLGDPLPEILNVRNWSVVGAVFMLFLHLFLFVGLALAAQLLRDSRNLVYGKAIDAWVRQATSKLNKALRSPGAVRSPGAKPPAVGRGGDGVRG